jgi:phosphoribosylformimino-5-aminoimidazole carboxamide ribotide isomerase
MMFEIIPAIDLRAGRCVRLLQGDFARETVYGDDPIAMTRHWQELGAPRLHVVDLDGALAGAPVQLPLVEKIVRAAQIPIQFGGGLRNLQQVDAALNIGVDRVVLGTAAIGGRDGQPASAFRRGCLARHDGRIVIGLDARDGKLAIDAWKHTTQRDVFDFARRLRDEGFERVIYTDIKRDGALSGPNVQDIDRLARIPSLAVLASGGISSLADLMALARTGAEAAIVGQALYSGAIKLPHAVQQLGGAAAYT